MFVLVISFGNGQSTALQAVTTTTGCGTLLIMNLKPSEASDCLGSGPLPVVGRSISLDAVAGGRFVE